MQLNSVTMTVMHTRECKFHVYLCSLIGFCFTEEVHSGRAGESQEVGEICHMMHRLPYQCHPSASSRTSKINRVFVFRCCHITVSTRLCKMRSANIGGDCIRVCILHAPLWILWLCSPGRQILARSPYSITTSSCENAPDTSDQFIID